MRFCLPIWSRFRITDVRDIYLLSGIRAKCLSLFHLFLQCQRYPTQFKTGTAQATFLLTGVRRVLRQEHFQFTWLPINKCKFKWEIFNVCLTYLCFFFPLCLVTGDRIAHVFNTAPVNKEMNVNYSVLWRRIIRTRQERNRITELYPNLLQTKSNSI